MKTCLVLAFVCAPFYAFGQTPAPETTAPQNLSETPESPMLGIHWARGFEPFARLHEARRGNGGSPLMTFHGGKILDTAVTKNIFWGKSWGNYSGDKITGLDTWYVGFDASHYAMTSDEYTGSNGQVTATTSHEGHVVDTSASASGARTSAILAEVCKAIPNPDPSGKGYYAVYADTKRGSAGYCAYHSYGTCKGTPVQFAYFFKLDGDAGCDPQDSSGLHSQGLAALANVSGHELSEARSDPANPGAWYDSSGEENGDKCAWTFNVPLVTFSNGSEWKIQGEWSNKAYSSGTGYPNSSGQKGCLDGH